MGNKHVKLNMEPMLQNLNSDSNKVIEIIDIRYVRCITVVSKTYISA